MRPVLLNWLIVISISSLAQNSAGTAVKTAPSADGEYRFHNIRTGIAADNNTWDSAGGFINGFAIAYKGKKSVPVNENGIPVTTKRYDEVNQYRNHIAAVRNGNRWGFINERGEEVTGFRYEKVWSFDGNQYMGLFNDQWYRVNEYGSEEQEPQSHIEHQSGFPERGTVLSQQISPNITMLTSSTATIACPPNLDFEYGNFTNWQTNIGQVTSSGGVNYILLPNNTWLSNTNTVNRQMIQDRNANPTATDLYGGFSVHPPNGSRYSLKLGSDADVPTCSCPNSLAEAVRYVINVPAVATDFAITFSYAVVLENPGTANLHTDAEQPRFIAKLYQPATGATIPCADFSFVASGSLPGFQSSAIQKRPDATVRYKNWSSVYVNLSEYAGQTLYLEFTTTDCTKSAHFGYAYVDVSECGITGSAQYNCNNNTATLTGPPGFQGYTWYNSNFTTQLGTGQTITIPSPSFGPNYRVIVTPYPNTGCPTCDCRDTLSITLNGTSLAIDAGPDKSVCAGSSVTIGPASTTGYTYQWTPSGGLSATNIASPVANPSATTKYYVTVTDGTTGCVATDSVMVTVTPKPIAAFNVNSASQCLPGNSFSFTTQANSPGTSYQWSFGDGSNSAVTNPSHVYSATGTYLVKLVTSANGCADSSSMQVTVQNGSPASFTINDSAQCYKGNSFLFSTPSTGTYTWFFGDGNTAATNTVSHTYAAPGTYYVRLIPSVVTACSDSTSGVVTVYETPVAAFAVNDSLQCLAGNSFAFSNSSSGTGSYHWDFGDNSVSAVTSPTHSYVGAGSYPVSLVVTTSQGCADTMTRQVVVTTSAAAVFQVNDSDQCLGGNAFNFNATGVTPGVSYNWSFGDGSTSTSANPSHSYAQAGTFNVQLLVSMNGCSDSTTQPVTVNPEPVAGFSINDTAQCLAANQFSFTNTTTGSATYQWNFGDNSTSTATSPAHSYAAAGNYTVTLTAITGSGCTDSATMVTIVYPEPTAGFNINNSSQCLSANQFSFSNTSTGSNSQSWNFGDNSTSQALNPVHSYASAGNYNVTLISTSANGCTDSLTRPVVVVSSPVAAFQVNKGDQCLKGNAFSFISTANGTGTVYNWSFGDGSVSNTANPSHSYLSAGNYTVKLIVSANGCSDSTSQNVTVNLQPLAGFSINSTTQCLAGNSFSFTNASTGGTSYLWNFGDNSTSATAVNPSHIYTSAGIFNVQLIAVNNAGCSDTASQVLTVKASPVVNYSVNGSSQCLTGNNFVFTANGSGSSSIVYQWQFGDGVSSTSQNPSHTYAAAGTYNVALTATADGCSDTASSTVIVSAQPVADFLINKAVQCYAGNNFQFTNTSAVAPGTLTYLWDFGDNSTNATVANPAHSYNVPGSFNVVLVAVSNSGCTDTITRQVIVTAAPAAAFSVDKGTQCLKGNLFKFTSNPASGSYTYNWNFGDGSLSALANPSHSYSIQGTYAVKLVVSSAGCTDSSSQNVSVNSEPVVVLTLPDSSLCEGETTTITSVVTPGSGNIAQQQWYINGILIPGLVANEITAGQGGTYLLSVSNSNGCTANASTTVAMHTPPVLTITPPPSAVICQGSSVVL
ncbi:MAG TPA: PKD domain-containing protein, partial [Chitinophagaceae bacterium]